MNDGYKSSTRVSYLNLWAAKTTTLSYPCQSPSLVSYLSLSCPPHGVPPPTSINTALLFSQINTISALCVTLNKLVLMNVLDGIVYLIRPTLRTPPCSMCPLWESLVHRYQKNSWQKFPRVSVPTQHFSFLRIPQYIVKKITSARHMTLPITPRDMQGDLGLH